jgi:hypothetical protein
MLSPGLVAVSNAQLTWQNNGANTATDPTLWLEAGTLGGGNGSAVSAWSDARGNTVPISVGNAGDTYSQPTLATSAVGTHNAVNFGGSSVLWGDDLPGTALFGSSSKSTLFFVLQTGAGNLGTAPFAWTAPDQPSHEAVSINVDTAGSIIFNHGPLGDSTITASTPTGWDTGFHVLAVQRDGNGGFIQVDSSPLSSAVSLKDPTLTLTPTRLSIGASYLRDPGETPGYNFNGQIAEILVFNDALSSGEFAAVTSYLQDKYISAVPEPSEYAVVFSAVCLVGAAVRRFRRQA